jgi:hypothetical protein
LEVSELSRDTSKEAHMPNRKNEPYKAGELETILSLAPTSQNIRFLAALLERSEEAITIVYKHAFEHGPFGASAGAQVQKIIAAKKRVGIAIGRMSLKSSAAVRRSNAKALGIQSINESIGAQDLSPSIPVSIWLATIARTSLGVRSP